jgi:hypothetical protein
MMAHFLSRAQSTQHTSSSTARRSTRRACSGSSGSPKIPRPVRRIAPKPMRLTRRSPPKENVPAAAAFGLASWSVMRLPSVSYRTDSNAVHPHLWAPSNQPDSARMAHIACKGVLMGFPSVGITCRYRTQAEG